MDYPRYYFEELDLQVTFETVGYSYVSPVIYERVGFMRAWARTSDKWAFSSMDMSGFVGISSEARQAFARRAADKWANYRNDRDRSKPAR